jgi:hypothetical protein
MDESLHETGLSREVKVLRHGETVQLRNGLKATVYVRSRGTACTADPVEGRGHRGMEPKEGKMEGTPSPTPISTRLQRVATLAKEAPDMAFTTLAHYIDIDWLREAYRSTRKDGATGVDGQTAQEYATALEGNLQSLLQRAKSGSYRAPPVRRVHIPKGQGKTRPIGIPTFEDRVLQRAVAVPHAHTRRCMRPLPPHWPPLPPPTHKAGFATPATCQPSPHELRCEAARLPSEQEGRHANSFTSAGECTLVYCVGVDTVHG